MRKSIGLLVFALTATLLFSCTASKKSFDPQKKYGIDQLRQDYDIFRGVLEQYHPGLYWYQSRDSMDYFFEKGRASIRDSMTETDFRTLLSYVISQVRCGHTAVKYSKAFSHYQDTAHLPAFPMALKFWADTAVVTLNLHREDSVLRRGTVITQVNGQPLTSVRDSLFEFLVTDARSLNGKYQALSTGFTFGHWYQRTYGWGDSLRIGYLDSMGQERSTWVRPWDPRRDSLFSRFRPPAGRNPPTPAPSPNNRLQAFGPSHLALDTVQSTAWMVLNTFDKGNHVRSFIKTSFATMRAAGVRNLVIDVRSNGGGEAGISTLLTRYLIDHPFKLADSLYAIRRSGPYDAYISKSFFYNLLMGIITKKRSDGRYHFGYFERHVFHPKKKNHFSGQTYILIGGNSFSATTLFAGSLKGQSNVKLVGEETGGAFYGNSAWIIQEVTLPQTQLRFLLPKFRLVVDHRRPKDGRGVTPDIWAAPTVEFIRKGIDFKQLKALELIDQKL